ncbi:TadE/TadG family type IV pilus assembly protein [Novosphingobium huizhouense]|uniref:TadE/TadG family type IV pilus assembly protein n=1 Tax=Novosphingobium huizhouense TaxID=2866625 RepID=UPI001CD912EC|nr:TadE/TadG family type IV pilus assembly protein [Novosphingobium huizhouense]
MTRLLALLDRLRRDSEGAYILEFGILAPVFVLMIFSLVDLGQLVYGKVLLEGAVEAAARDSSLETADTVAADATVTSTVRNILPGANVTSTRTSYYDFADIARAEKWNDTNKDGACASGETYVDENRNGRWDANIGQSGNGGAYDVVIYTVTVTYNPLIKLPFVPGFSGPQTLVSKSVRKNQPFATQKKYGSSSGICT